MQNKDYMEGKCNGTIRCTNQKDGSDRLTIMKSCLMQKRYSVNLREPFM